MTDRLEQVLRARRELAAARREAKVLKEQRDALLEACEAMLARYATGYNANDNEAEQARAALRKAKGEGDD